MGCLSGELEERERNEQRNPVITWWVLADGNVHCTSIVLLVLELLQVLGAYTGIVQFGQIRHAVPIQIVSWLYDSWLVQRLLHL